MPVLTSSSGSASVPRRTRASVTESSASSKAFQHVSFPLPEKLPVMSEPVIAWNAGSAAVFTGPRASAIGLSLMQRLFGGLPVTKNYLSHGYVELPAQGRQYLANEYKPPEQHWN